MKIAKRHNVKGFTLVELLVVIAIIAVLAGIGTPLILRARKAGDRTEAANNAKAIAGALNEFRNEQGSYPCLATRELLEDEGVDNLPEGTDANAYLAQLIVTDIVDSETYFYAPSPGIVKGDDIKKPGDLLKRGENGFAYIMTEDERPLGGDLSITPIVIAPLKQGGENPKFDGSPYGGQYVYGTIGGASKTGDISDDGIAESKGRESLFEQGRDSLFGNDIPVIKAPTGVK